VQNLSYKLQIYKVTQLGIEIHLSGSYLGTSRAMVISNEQTDRLSLLFENLSIRVHVIGDIN